MAEHRSRLVDLLAALSVATDLGMGQPPETALRSSLLATALARSMGRPESEVHTTFYGALLRHIGCTATSLLEARLFGGDELVSRRAAQPVDFGDPREMLGLTISTGRGTGAQRPRAMARAVLGTLRHGAEIQRSVCDAASLLVRRLELGPDVQDCVAQQFERWDGKGPRGLTGEEIALPARVSEVANQAELFVASQGQDAALRMVEHRAGGWFDPGVARAFGRVGRQLMRELEAVDPWRAAVEAEPAPVEVVDESDLDRVAQCLGDMVDLKSPSTVGHSRGVADLSETAGRDLGLPEADVVDLRRAALVHDLGRLGVSSGIWEKATPLTRAEWEQVRLHPYHTERILACSAAYGRLGRVAGLHHERLDGSGYHRGVAGPAIPVAARVLAAADAYQTATQSRPHRPARGPQQAARRLADEGRAGRLDAGCVAAVVEAAGHPRPRVRRDWPAGLSDREVEVLRLVARGLANEEIAHHLVISRRTAEHHVQHIYAKIGHSTRPAATLFALEHDLLGDVTRSHPGP